MSNEWSFLFRFSNQNIVGLAELWNESCRRVHDLTLEMKPTDPSCL